MKAPTTQLCDLTGIWRGNLSGLYGPDQTGWQRSVYLVLRSAMQPGFFRSKGQEILMGTMIVDGFDNPEKYYSGLGGDDETGSSHLANADRTVVKYDQYGDLLLSEGDYLKKGIKGLWSPVFGLVARDSSVMEGCATVLTTDLTFQHFVLNLVHER